jgi:plasmid maintenance system antidote protein VapI
MSLFTPVGAVFKNYFAKQLGISLKELRSLILEMEEKEILPSTVKEKRKITPKHQKEIARYFGLNVA